MPLYLTDPREIGVTPRVGESVRVVFTGYDARPVGTGQLGPLFSRVISTKREISGTAQEIIVVGIPGAPGPFDMGAWAEMGIRALRDAFGGNSWDSSISLPERAEGTLGGPVEKKISTAPYNAPGVVESIGIGVKEGLDNTAKGIGKVAAAAGNVGGGVLSSFLGGLGIWAFVIIAAIVVAAFLYMKGIL